MSCHDSKFVTWQVAPGTGVRFAKTPWGHWSVRVGKDNAKLRSNCKLARVGRHTVTSGSTLEQLQNWHSDQAAHNYEMLLEVPTKTCDRCETPCWYFIRDERSSTRICLGPYRRGCGRSYRMAYQKQGQLYLNDDGKASKSQWECTPGMTSRDTGIYLKGKRAFTSHEKFHHVNMRKMRTMIDDIMDDLPQVMGSEGVCKSAKAILTRLYNNIHPEDESTVGDQADRMWHSPPNIAATCILCAVIAFESRVGDSVFTVPRIVAAAQGYVPRKAKRRRGERQARDVSVRTMLKYAHRLKRRCLVSVELPNEVPIEWTMHASDNIQKERLRIAEFQKRTPVTVHLPHDESWGLALEEIDNFIRVDGVEASGPAFRSGVSVDDYLIAINDTTIGVHTNLEMTMQYIGNAKKAQRNVKLVFMRKK